MVIAYPEIFHTCSPTEVASPAEEESNWKKLWKKLQKLQNYLFYFELYFLLNLIKFWEQEEL